MEAWQIVLASMVTGIAYYGIGCVIANKTCTCWSDDADRVITAIFWPIVVLSKVLILPFKYLE